MRQSFFAVVLLLAGGCNCGTVRLGQTRLSLEVDPSSVDFGTLAVHTSSARTITLTNVSTTSLRIETLELAGDHPESFSSVPEGGPFELKAGQTLSVDVIFEPETVGNHTARLVVSSHADNAPMLLIPLVGNAVSDCVSATCGPADGGHDAGTDAGTPDAGLPDAGPPDAGTPDASVPEMDAGMDAGFDAGVLEEFDGGPPCSVTGTCCPDGLLRCGAACCPALDVAAGETHTCALVTGGTVRCWGEATQGQLGNGSFGTRSRTPVEVQGLTNVSTLRSGGRFSCALTSAGAVWCWGDNSSGQLGNGGTNPSAVPVQVSGLTGGVSELTVSSCSACVRSSSGVVSCWGCNSFSQLGSPGGGQRNTPTAVPGMTGVSALNDGLSDSYSCGALSTGGAKCWGYNGFGQLGTGDVVTPPGPVSTTLPPQGAHLTGAVSRGFALTTSGDLKAWGRNDHGQLGNGTKSTAPSGMEPPPVLTAVDVVGGPYRQVSGGSLYLSCGLTTGNTLKCWGGAGGFVGDGTTDERVTPVPVSTLANDVTGVSVGGGPSGGFACAVRSTGGVWCWGQNRYGQLGDGSATNRQTPTAITDP